MKKLLIGIAAIVLMVGFAAGCGPSGGDGGGSGGKRPDIPARSIEDGAEKYDPFQAQCPVCGSPIYADHHAEVEQDGQSARIYFDKEECVQKFEQNPEEYLQDYTSPAKQRGNYQQKIEQQRQKSN